jgi:apolipoprotein N-acyltransferase
VPAQELGAARLRAIETGRELVQAAPTGYGALVDHRGRVRARTTLGRRQVLHGRVTLRAGDTVYTRAGDGPVLAVAVTCIAAAWALTRRRPGGAQH